MGQSVCPLGTIEFPPYCYPTVQKSLGEFVWVCYELSSSLGLFLPFVSKLLCST